MGSTDAISRASQFIDTENEQLTRVCAGAAEEEIFCARNETARNFAANVTRGIRELERQFSAHLFDRTRRAVFRQTLACSKRLGGYL
jgi:hypothetical protein